MKGDKLDNGKQLDGSQQQKTVTINITPEDQVTCACGGADWFQPVYVFKFESPLIGTKPKVTIQPIAHLPISCVTCGLPLVPDSIKSIKDRKKDQAQVVKPAATETDIRNAARALALQTVHSIVRQAEILGVTPEVFAEIVDQENKSMQEPQPQLVGVPQ